MDCFEYANELEYGYMGLTDREMTVLMFKLQLLFAYLPKRNFSMCICDSVLTKQPVC